MLLRLQGEDPLHFHQPQRRTAIAGAFRRPPGELSDDEGDIRKQEDWICWCQLLAAGEYFLLTKTIGTAIDWSKTSENSTPSCIHSSTLHWSIPTSLASAAAKKTAISERPTVPTTSSTRTQPRASSSSINKSENKLSTNSTPNSGGCTWKCSMRNVRPSQNSKSAGKGSWKDKASILSRFRLPLTSASPKTVTTLTLKPINNYCQKRE